MARSPKDKTATKPARTARARVKPEAEAAAKPALTVVESASRPNPAALKLKDLVDAVAGTTGGRKPDVKAAVEATLAAMSEALAAGKALTLPPLGKLRVVKTKGPALTLKLRRADGGKPSGLALANDGEDS